MAEKPSTDAVGYKKPPKDHQFLPGQSGNPHGRPKGRNFKSDLREELAETIAFRDGARDVMISKQRALIKRLIAEAIRGDTRAIASVLSFCSRAFGDEDDDEQRSAEDSEIVDAFAPRPANRQAIQPLHDNT
jgi:hypothetical protein